MADYSKQATLIGVGALAMWMMEPLLVSEIQGLPIFETLTIIFASSFLFTAARLTINKRWHLIFNHSKSIWLVGLIGICFSDFAYVYGAQLAPIAHIDLIDYMWPCMVVVFMGFLPKEKFTFQHLIGALIGFIGISTLIMHEIIQNGFNLIYFKGYVAALLGACCWGGYCAFSRAFKNLPTEMIGMYCGVAVIICLFGHFSFETFVIPTGKQSLFAIILGATGAGIAYQLWDYGIKFGNIYFLSSLTYLAQVVAMSLLVIFGKEPFSLSLVASCILTSIGVFINGMDNERFNRLTSNIFKIPNKNIYIPESITENSK